MTKRVLVLGASGFIGRHLLDYLDASHEVTMFNHRSQNLELSLDVSIPDVLINCAASPNNANMLDSVEANILYQMNCLRLISRRRSTPFKWIQIGSYYELQIEFGRNDNYSLHKAMCRSLLERANEERIIDLTTIFLPHVFGPDERPNRIVSSLKTKLNLGEEVRISSGEQHIPLLAVEDACRAISAAIKTDQLTCSATPIWYDRVLELAGLIHEKIQRGSIFADPTLVSVDAKYPKVVFPPKVRDWEPKILFDEFLSSVATAK